MNEIVAERAKSAENPLTIMTNKIQRWPLQVLALMLIASGGVDTFVLKLVSGRVTVNKNVCRQIAALEVDDDVKYTGTLFL